MAEKQLIKSFKLNEQGLAHIFGEFEAKLMEVVWVLERPTVQEIIDYLDDDLNYKTTMTVLNRLVDKGVLTRQKIGRAFGYIPVVSRDELLANVFDQMVRGMFDSDFRQIALAQIIDTAETIDTDLLDDLSRLIEQKKQER